MRPQVIESAQSTSENIAARPHRQTPSVRIEIQSIHENSQLPGFGIWDYSDIYGRLPTVK
jgi:hypothetical protein